MTRSAEFPGVMSDDPRAEFPGVMSDGQRAESTTGAGNRTPARHDELKGKQEKTRGEQEQATTRGSSNNDLTTQDERQGVI